MTKDTEIEERYKDTMSQVAHALDGLFNGDKKGKDRQTGFVLLTFPFDDHEGRTNYISNGGDRKDIVCMFKEMIARFEGQPEIAGHA